MASVKISTRLSTEISFAIASAPSFQLNCERSKRTPQNAPRIPRPPPAMERSKHSVKSWRASRKRRSEEHTSELQSHSDLVCRLLLEKKKKKKKETKSKIKCKQYRTTRK